VPSRSFRFEHQSVWPVWLLSLSSA